MKAPDVFVIFLQWLVRCGEILPYFESFYPIRSMYGIFTYIYHEFMVNINSTWFKLGLMRICNPKKECPVPDTVYDIYFANYTDFDTFG